MQIGAEVESMMYANFSLEHIAKQRASREAREGFAAFLEKRPPAWASPEE